MGSKTIQDQVEQNFQIRDADINCEVLRLSGELQVAKLEIKRLREKLLQSETVSKVQTVMASPKQVTKIE